MTLAALKSKGTVVKLHWFTTVPFLIPIRFFNVPLRTALFMGRGGAANTRVPRGQGIPTGYAYRAQRATTKRSYAEFSAIDIKVFY